MNSVLTDPNATLGELREASGLAASDGGGGITAIVLGSLAVFIVLAIVWYLLQVMACWKIFTKAGEPGWKSIIPFYNTYIQYRLTWNTLFFWIGLALSVVYGVAGSFEGLAAVAAAAIYIMENYRLSRAFGHGAGYTVGLVLLNPVFKLILGFGKDTYAGNSSEEGE